MTPRPLTVGAHWLRAGVSCLLTCVSPPGMLAAPSESEDAGRCTLVIRPVTATENVPPPGLLVWVSAGAEPPRSELIGTVKPFARFDGLPCGPATYGVFLPIPDVFEVARPLAQGSVEKLRRDTLVEPIVPDLGQLKVEVVTTSGDPVESRVRVVSRTEDRTPKYLAVMTTDEAGRATFLVPSGDYDLLASEANSERFVLAEVNGQSTQKPVLVNVQASSVVRFIVHPDDESGVPVTGRLVDSNGRQVSGPTVVFEGSDDKVTASADGTGTFTTELPLVGFPWTLDVDDDSGRWRLAQATQLLEPPRGDLVLALASVGPRVTGVVMDDDGAPVSRAWMVMEGCAGDDAYRHYTRSQSSGEFELGCRSECSMAIEASAKDLLEHHQVLAPTSCDGEPLEIRLSRGARLVGRVTTESGLPVGGITLGAGGPGTDDATQTEADGTYELGPLAPGRVQLQMFDTTNYYQDHSLRIKDASGELLEADVLVDGGGEIHRDLVVVEGGAICFDMPEFFGTSSLELSLSLNRLMVFVFEDETKPRDFARKLLDFDDERAVGCVHGVQAGFVRVLVLDNADPAKIAPTWGLTDDELGVVEVDVHPGGQHTVDLAWQPQAHVAFQFPPVELEVQAIFARPKNESGEWGTWAPVPLQRLISFDSDVAQWKLQRVAGLDDSADRSLVLAPGRWQIRIDGVGKDEEPRSYASPSLDLEPHAITSTSLTEFEK